MREKVVSTIFKKSTDRKMKKLQFFTIFFLISYIYGKLSSSKAGSTNTIQGGSDSDETGRVKNNKKKRKNFLFEILFATSTRF